MASGPRDDELVAAAQAAGPLGAHKALASGKLAGLVVRMLAHRKLKSFRNAVVAYRSRRKSDDERAHLVENSSHSSFPLGAPALSCSKGWCKTRIQAGGGADVRPSADFLITRNIGEGGARV
jgi:hypothetical protein